MPSGQRPISPPGEGEAARPAGGGQEVWVWDIRVPSTVHVPSWEDVQLHRPKGGRWYGEEEGGMGGGRWYGDVMGGGRWYGRSKVVWGIGRLHAKWSKVGEKIKLCE